MTYNRPQPKQKGSGWSLRGAALTVLHGLAAWALILLHEFGLLTDVALVVLAFIAVPVAAYAITKFMPRQNHGGDPPVQSQAHETEEDIPSHD